MNETNQIDSQEARPATTMMMKKRKMTDLRASYKVSIVYTPWVRHFQNEKKSSDELLKSKDYKIASPERPNLRGKNQQKIILIKLYHLGVKTCAEDKEQTFLSQPSVFLCRSEEESINHITQ